MLHRQLLSSCKRDQVYISCFSNCYLNHLLQKCCFIETGIKVQIIDIAFRLYIGFQSLFWPLDNEFWRPDNQLWPPSNVFWPLENVFWRPDNLLKFLGNVFWLLGNVLCRQDNALKCVDNLFWSLLLIPRPHTRSKLKLFSSSLIHSHYIRRDAPPVGWSITITYIRSSVS